MVDAEGSDASPVYRGNFVGQLSWSPAGDRIALTTVTLEKGRTRANLSVLNPESGAIQERVENAFSPVWIAIDRIAYFEEQDPIGGRRHLSILDLKSGSTKRLPGGPHATGEVELDIIPCP